MSPLLLDINDRNLQVWEGERPVLESPGYAWLDGRQLRFGVEARGQARRHPRDINHRFWWQLNMEPLQTRFGSSRHSADLVHAHLLDIHQQAGRPGQLVFAAPGSLQTDQLSLLLGIAQQCPFETTGLVDRAVASTVGAITGSRCWHLNLQLHQAVVTHLAVEDGQLCRKQVTPIPGAGWLALQDSLANTLSQAFISQTRFDPRRKAATEQDLYDQLPAILVQLQEQSICNIEINGHRVRLEAQALIDACQGHYARINGAIQTAGEEIFLDPSIATLPGIGAAVPGSTALEDSALAATVSRHRELIEGGPAGVHFITRLPVVTRAAAASAAPPAPEPASPPPEPTPADPPVRVELVLANGECSVQPAAGTAPRVNGVTIDGPTRLGEGDVLEIGEGRRWRLSELVGDDAP
jgi:hypothetical protein